LWYRSSVELHALAQVLGLSFTSGISLYATIAFVGLAQHLGWIGPLPGALAVLAYPWVFGAAGAMALVEAVALLVPGVATAWEAVHTFVRPFGAAALAVLSTWGTAESATIAGVVAGVLGLGTHVAKLGVRAAIDTSPEPVTNAAATGAELGVVAAISWIVWEHPWIALAIALAMIATMVLVVRALLRVAKRAWWSLFADFRRTARPS
jgi:hypothetical protein